MSPSDRRKDLWKKSTRKQRKRLAKRFAGTFNGHYTVVFGLTAGIDLVYVQVFGTFSDSGKVYLPKSLTSLTVSAIVETLLTEARLQRELT